MIAKVIDTLKGFRKLSPIREVIEDIELILINEKNKDLITLLKQGHQ